MLLFLGGKGILIKKISKFFQVYIPPYRGVMVGILYEQHSTNCLIKKKTNFKWVLNEWPLFNKIRKFSTHTETFVLIEFGISILIDP